VDARRGGCDDAPAIVPLHGVGHGAEAKLAGDGSAPCLPANLGRFYRTKLKSRGQTLARNAAAQVSHQTTHRQITTDFDRHSQ